MNPEDISLESVNWEHGMLLTPEHFLRQERYVDSSLLWLLRYCTNIYGLVGGGPRLPASERGAVKYDPVVALDHDGEELSLSVSQCRGLTPAGLVIDIEPGHAVHRRFARADLEGVNEALIYVVRGPVEKQAVDGPVDDANPQSHSARRPAYRISLDPPADQVPYSIVAGRLRRPEHGAGYELDSRFIPACTSMVSYSELTRAWQELVDQTNTLIERYTDLYRAMQELMPMVLERDIASHYENETLQFVGRMVASAQQCIYATLDPVQPPEQFFSHIRKFLHSAAVFLQLSPPVRQYFDQLKDTGETEYTGLLERQKQLLQIRRRWELSEDLAVEVRQAREHLDILQRIELALEGKYIDFRYSRTIDSMNFVFDREGRDLYKITARQSRVQSAGQDWAFVFAGLQLEERHEYRLVLSREENSPIEPGTELRAEIRINEGAGFRHEPEYASCRAASLDQMNFEFDFRAPREATINDIQVRIPGHFPIRRALLFMRHRFYSSRGDELPPPSAPRRVREPAAEPREPPTARREPPTYRQAAGSYPQPAAEPPSRSRLEPPAPGRHPEPPPPREAPPSRDTPPPFRRVSREEEPSRSDPRREPYEEAPPTRRGGEPAPPWEKDDPRGRPDDEPPPPPRRRSRLS